jgi:hypothetical protein
MCIVHSYNMSDKIKKMSINVILKTFDRKSWIA